LSGRDDRLDGIAVRPAVRIGIIATLALGPRQFPDITPAL
jgi:hypothetical protein